jgi:hypothetical protein
LKQAIDAALRRLCGKRLVALGRAANLQHFTFSDLAGHESALHVQCPWRLVGAAGILVGGEDYWRSATPETAEAEFNRGVVGSRWLDVRNAAVRALVETGGIEAQSVEGDALGGFVLHLSAGLRLDVFPDGSPADHDAVEYWRVFDDRGEHFVVSSDGIDRVAEV